MKRIMFLTCVGSLTLALTAWGAPNKTATKSAKRTVSAHAVSPRGGGHSMSHAAPMRASRAASAPRMHTNRAVSNTARVHSRSNVAVARERNINHLNRSNRANTVRVDRANAPRNNRVVAARTANTDARIGPRANAQVNRRGNINGVTNQVVNPARNAPIVNNWRSTSFSGQNYAAFRDYRRQWHDRNWWNNNYTRIILVGGGWWYWNAGYWYPAWGYDPYYTYYPYDGPIYGYGDLTPDQVIVNVQTQLRNDGYYVGSIDGILGSQTRRAIAAFQADHGLAVTSAVDEPTLSTLGLS